jgi:hypothetical protein
VSTLGTLGRRLATGFVELGEIIIRELLLGGDPVTAFLVLGGLSIWAVTFGIGGYLALRAILSGAWRRLTERRQKSPVR